MKIVSLQITYRKGKPFAAYIYLPQQNAWLRRRPRQVNCECPHRSQWQRPGLILGAPLATIRRAVLLESEVEEANRNIVDDTDVVNRVVRTLHTSGVRVGINLSNSNRLNVSDARFLFQFAEQGSLWMLSPLNPAAWHSPSSLIQSASHANQEQPA